jgi:HK97 family phage portal protein
LLLWGNGYAQIIRDGAGRVKYLYPLLTNKMDVWRDEHGEIFYTYYRNHDEKRPDKKEGGITLNREDVLHFKGLGFDGLVGYSPIAIARNAIGMAIAAENYGATFFANGANPSGVLEHPEGLGRQANVDIRETWNALYRGSGNHSIAVLDDGLKFKPITIPPDQAQFLETRKYQLGEIARIFGVPLHMIGDLERATFSNIEHQSIEFVTRTINPWVKRLEQCMDLALLSPAERKTYSIRFNLDAMLRGDYKTRMEGYKIGRQNGWLSANDIRDLEHMNPIPAEDGGDKYFVNANMVELKQAGFFTKGNNEQE